MTLPLAALLALAPAAPPSVVPSWAAPYSMPAQGPLPEVQGILLVTGDATLVKRVRKELRHGSTADLRRDFPERRFEIVPWDASRRIVIDRTTGPLGQIGDQALLDQGFLRQIAKKGVLDVASMTPEEYGAAKSLFGKWAGAGGRPSIEPNALGLGIGYDIRLKSGGTTRSISVGLVDPRKEAMYGALRQAFGGDPSRAKGDLTAEDRSSVPPPRDEFDLVYLGLTRRNDAEALRLVSDALRTIETRMRQESASAGESLLKGLGYRLAKGTEGSAPMDQLPKDLRFQLALQLRDTWGYLGFGSQTEALGFLQDADSFDVRTTFGLRQMIDPGDPSTGSASAHVEYQYATIPGAYVP